MPSILGCLWLILCAHHVLAAIWATEVFGAHPEFQAPPEAALPSPMASFLASSAGITLWLTVLVTAVLQDFIRL